MDADHSYAHLAVEAAGHVLVATMDRPDVLNALNDALRADLLLLAETFRADDGLRVLVLTGAGRGFCSGADLSSGASLVEPGQNALLDEYEGAGQRALAFWGIDKPVIAAVNGVAAGAGMSLALGCDLRVGDSRARFRSMFAERGLSPDSGLSYTLTRTVGYARAADLVLTSRDVGADEAYRLGLLDRLVPEGAALTEAVDLAAQIARLPPLAVRASKRVLQRNADASFRDSLLHETSGLNRAKRAEADLAEAAASFRERRAPEFTGK